MQSLTREMILPLGGEIPATAEREITIFLNNISIPDLSYTFDSKIENISGLGENAVLGGLEIAREHLLKIGVISEAFGHDSDVVIKFSDSEDIFYQVSTLDLITLEKNHTYLFHVNDSAGLWGELRMKGKTQEEAEQACRNWLQENEIGPEESLLSDYHLDLINIS